MLDYKKNTRDRTMPQIDTNDRYAHHHEWMDNTKMRVALSTSMMAAIPEERLERLPPDMLRRLNDQIGNFLRFYVFADSTPDNNETKAHRHREAQIMEDKLYEEALRVGLFDTPAEAQHWITGAKAMTMESIANPRQFMRDHGIAEEQGVAESATR